MDSGSSCKVIYEYCFLKLKPSILASMVDSQVPLVGFSGEKSRAIGEVLLEIMIGNAHLTRSETLNFVIVRSNSQYNMLLGRTAMQKMGMIVSMIHRAIKFHTTQGVGTVTTTQNEVEELTRAGILLEVVHQTWVANPVMVKKNNRGWRMCVDFTDINKACPKDCYPLLEMDWK
ncbi:reverse transcriptase domain-containing protein, partial [Tanacetum coccineum]